MPLAETITRNQYTFSAYDETSVTVLETVHTTSLIVSADHLEKWDVESVSALEEKLLEPILSLKPQIVILGTGKTQQFPAAQIHARFGKHGIGLEVMATDAACRTYNILVAEDRNVVAALII